MNNFLLVSSEILALIKKNIKYEMTYSLGSIIDKVLFCNKDITFCGFKVKDKYRFIRSEIKFPKLYTAFNTIQPPIKVKYKEF